MFIHIGGDTMVRTRDIIGIFDIAVKDDANTVKFFELAGDNQAIDMVEVGEVKSFVVTEGKIYFSPISSLTLKKRAQFEHASNWGEA